MSARRGGQWVAMGCCALAAMPAWSAVYGDRAAFLAALSSAGDVVETEGFESVPLGLLVNGSTLGAFGIAFDPALTQPAIVSDGAGGHALGGAPFDVFVGGDSVTLSYLLPRGLQAFGVDVFFAPNGGDLPAGLYQLSVADGRGSTVSSGAALPVDGGSLFLGFVADPAGSFAQVTLSSVDGSTLGMLTPAYQIDNLVFAAAVPELGTASLLMCGLAATATWARRRIHPVPQ